MDDLNKIINDINKLKFGLIQLINTTEPSQELFDKLSDIKHDNPDIYEIITLVKSEFHTDSKITKKQLVDIISKLFDIKIDLVNKIIKDKQDVPKKHWIVELINFNTAKVLVFTILSILITLFIMFIINPEASKATVDSLNSTTKAFKGEQKSD